MQGYVDFLRKYPADENELSVVRKVKSIIFAGWIIIVYAKQKHPAWYVIE